MLSKNEIKYIQSLFHKKNRDAENLFVVEGVKNVNELLQSDFTVANVYAEMEWIEETANKAILISAVELKKISNQINPNKVLAIAHKKTSSSLPVFKGKINLVLDGIQDPGNLGTIIRLADWFGVSTIIASRDTVDFYNPKVIQASMGSFLRVDTWYMDLKEIFSTNDIPVFGAVMNGKSIFETEKSSEAFLLIGNEGHGIRNELLPLITHQITIPRKGKAESLNASVATGIILAQMII